MELLKNYKSSLILLGSVILGGILGLIFKEKTQVLEPLGNLFLNLMFTIIVPLVFFSVSSAISSMSSMKRLGKIMGSIFIVFSITAILASILAVIGAILVNPTANIDVSTIKSLISQNASVPEAESITLAQRIVNTFTVSDFFEIFSRKNMLQLIIFSIVFGISTVLIKDESKSMSDFLESGTKVTMKFVEIIMYYAPIGLGSYFAVVIGQLGPQILEGYARAFFLYLALSLIYYFIFFSLYAFISGSKKGFFIFWKNAIDPSVTALATCSSAACIPANLKAVKKMNVPSDICETVVPLGANTHKDGSVIGGVIKITFLLGIFGKDMHSMSSILMIIGISYLVGAVMGAIPGGGMIGEMLIISVYGFPFEVLPIIAVISTIIDAPATLLNSAGNTVCSMLVTRLVEGKDWLENKI